MIYENVEEYCTEKHLSICEFEKLCGIGNGTVGKWRKGCAVPSIRTLTKIEESTGISVSEWLLWRNSK